MILLDLGRLYDSGLQFVRTILTRRRQRYAGAFLALALLMGCAAVTEAQEKSYWLERGSQIKGSCLGKTDGQDLSGRCLDGRLADTSAPPSAPSPSGPAAQTPILASAPPPTSSPTPTSSAAAPPPPPSEAQPRAPPTDTQTEASSAKDTDRPLLGDRISAEAVATAENQAFFWSGRSSGIANMSERAISVAETKGGKTLEKILDERGTHLPSWNPNDPVTVQLWESASRAYAAGASGTVHAVLGQELRLGSIWESVELPTLIANPNVKKIIGIDPVSGVERVIFSRH